MIRSVVGADVRRCPLCVSVGCMLAPAAVPAARFAADCRLFCQVFDSLRPTSSALLHLLADRMLFEGADWNDQGLMWSGKKAHIFMDDWCFLVAKDRCSKGHALQHMRNCVSQRNALQWKPATAGLLRSPSSKRHPSAQVSSRHGLLARLDLPVHSLQEPQHHASSHMCM